MIRPSVLVIFALVSVLVGLNEATQPQTEPALLVVSFDGFRPEYLRRSVTPNLNKFRREGIFARFMLPVFPTKTFVNHFTIATGLYPGKHGVLANSVYDTKLKKKLGYSYELFHYNESTVPIWTANELAGKHSGCWWPGCEYEYSGVNCTFSRSFDGNIDFKERVDTVMTWFTHKKTPVNLVMLYIEEPDEHAHVYGPESDKITKIVEKVDNLTRYIQEKLIENKLENRVNVIYTSDHGMKGVSPPNFINLTEFVNKDSCVMYGTSPVLQIVPINSTKENEIFMNLTKAAERNGHFKVYNHENIPARWHTDNPIRMGPILAVADVGYGFQDLMDQAKEYQEKYNVTITNETQYGVHGYDNIEPSMNAIFMAKGPFFAKSKVLKSVNMINLYNLFCLVLDIECGENDGLKKPNVWYKSLAKTNKNAVREFARNNQ